MKFSTFNGDLKGYRRFKELFMHCSRGLNDIKCFYQLRESMINNRERSMIKGYISVRVWEILDEYYEEDSLSDSVTEKGVGSVSPGRLFIFILRLKLSPK